MTPSSRSSSAGCPSGARAPLACRVSSNPQWTEKLGALESSVVADGRLRSLRIHTRVALTADRPARNLRLDVGNEKDAVGASVASGGAGGVEVQGWNFVDWVEEFATALAEPWVPIVVRMDVEGSEYGVLRDLATSGLARRIGNPLSVGLEWHRFRKAVSTPPQVRK